jgi:hypothetical protein
MIQVISLGESEGALMLGRMTGHCGPREWRHLRALIARAPLTQGSRVVLDLSGTRHMHFRAAPELIALARRLQGRGAQLTVIGLTDYLVKIVELSSGLEGRDFIEQHGTNGSPLPGPADPGMHTGMPYAGAPGPHGLGVVSVN